MLKVVVTSAFVCVLLHHKRAGEREHAQSSVLDQLQTMVL